MIFKVVKSIDLWPTTSELATKLFDKNGNLLKLTDPELQFSNEREAVSHLVTNPRGEVVGRVLGRDIEF